MERTDDDDDLSPLYLTKLDFDGVSRRTNKSDSWRINKRIKYWIVNMMRFQYL